MLVQRAGRDRQDRAAGGGARGRRDAPCCSARGSELERSFAFGGVQQLFARVPVPEDGAAAHAAAAFAVGGEPDQAVLHGLYWLAAGPGPLAIVVDDAHWLDRQSLRWLAYMVNRVADLPLAMMLAARSDEPDELLTRIALHPSTRALHAEAALARPRSPQLAGEERAAAIHEATGGNPFYVHALLADEAARRAPVVDVGRAAPRRRCRRRARRSRARSPSPAPAARSPRGWPASTSATPSRPPRRSRAPTSCAATASRIRSSQQAVYAAIPAARASGAARRRRAPGHAARSGSPRR